MDFWTFHSAIDYVLTCKEHNPRILNPLITSTQGLIIWLKRGDLRVLLSVFDFAAILIKLNFVKTNSIFINYGYDYNAPACMVASQ